MKSLSAEVRKTVLDNGLTVLVKEANDLPLVVIHTHVKAGYFNESDAVVGISHLIEHMFFKGTKRRGVGEIAKETKSLGGYLNASTIYDHTSYYTVIPSAHFSRGLDIQSDALMRSVFDPEELRKETEVVIEEAKRKLDNPDAVALERMFALAFRKHRMRRWRIGTEEGLRALTRDDFLRFHRDLYRPENIILVVVGDIVPDKGLKEIQKYFGSFERGEMTKEVSPPEPSQSELRYQLHKGDITQAYFAMGFHTPDVLHGDTYALEMLAFILGRGRSSRLYQRIKHERNLVNSLSVFNYALEDLGIFVIDVVAQPAKVREAEQEIINEISKLRTKPIAEAELERARNVLESMYVFNMESVSGQASLLASYEALGGYHLLEEYLANLFRVTAADIAGVAGRYLCLENSSLVEYVPQKAALAAMDVRALEAQHQETFSVLDAVSGDAPVEEAAPPHFFHIVSGNGDSKKRVLHKKLPSGLTLIAKENHELPIVSLGIFAKGGRIHEDRDKAGLTGLMARSMLKGTARRTAPQIALEIENLGTSAHFSNDADYVSCSLNILSKNFYKGWDILADILTQPIFPDEELEKEIENTQAAILQTQDDMFRYPLQLCYASLFENHPYGLPSLGFSETVRAVSRDDLVECHEKLYRAENLVVAVNGDIESDRFAETVEQGLQSLMGQQSASENLRFSQSSASSGDNAASRNKEQTAIVLGFPGPKYADREYHALTVLQNILSGLGGRFFEELRGRQSLAYTVSAFLVSRLHGGAFLSYIATAPSKEETARRGLLREFEKLVSLGVTDEELERAISFTIGTYKIGLERYRAQMVRYARNQLLGRQIDEVESFARKIADVDKADIQAAVLKFIDPDRCVAGIVRGKNGRTL